MAEEERYWLVHKGGYTVARLLESLPDGRFRVAVAGREMIVDSTDADKANPTSLDRVEDLAVLRYLNETSTVHLLRQRSSSSKKKKEEIQIRLFSPLHECGLSECPLCE